MLVALPRDTMSVLAWRRNQKELRLDHGWATDPGMARSRNEDSVLAPLLVTGGDGARVLLAGVADGVGGMRDGDRASNAVVSALGAAFRPESRADVPAALLTAAAAADTAVRRLNEGRAEDETMASTLVAVALLDGRARIVHVGDSRAYLLHRGHLTAVTRDHSVVADAVEAGDMTEEEASRSPMRNLLTRGLGAAAAEPELSREVRLQMGDRLLLCSDGVHGVVPEALLSQTLRRDETAQALAERCVRHALDRGAPDNASAVVIRVESSGGRT